jgi:hypothetical protein
MRRFIWFVIVTMGAPLAFSQTYGRLDFSLQNAQGQAIAGATINVYSQSACGVAYGTAATLYPAATGGTPLTQPLLTDGRGANFAYASPGCVTVVYNSPFTGTLTFKDQNVVAGSTLVVPITIPNGGTGATTAAAAVGNLLGNPSAGTYDLQCSSGTNCVPAAVTSGGGACLSGLTANSTGAAAANTTAINTSLSTPGLTYLCNPAPGGTTKYYINGPVVQYSNTKLKMDPGVSLVSNNNMPLLVNYQETQAFGPGVSATYSSGCTWTAGTTCSLNFPGHGFPIGSGFGFGGQWVWAQAAEGFLVSGQTLAYTSGGTGCTNGTQNVSLSNGYATFSNIGTVTVSGNVPTGSMTLTTSTQTWGFEPNQSYTGTVATCTGAVTFGPVSGAHGVIDGAFSGVFQVVSVTDANTLVVQMNRQPSSASLDAPIAGEYYVKHVDVNLTDEDLTLDYNNGSSGTVLNEMGAMFFGVENVQFLGRYSPRNGAYYGFFCAGVDNLHMRNYWVPDYEDKNGLQCRAPLTNVTFENTTGNSADDTDVMINDSGGAAFAAYDVIPWATGDLLHDTIDGTHGYSGVHAGVFYLDAQPGYIGDFLKITNGDAHPYGTPTFPLYGFERNGPIYHAEISHISCVDNLPACIEADGAVYNYKVSDITCGNLYNRTTAMVCFKDYDQYTPSGQNLSLSNFVFFPQVTGDTAIQLSGVYTNVDVGNSYDENLNGVVSYFVDVNHAGAGNTKKIALHDSVFGLGGGFGLYNEGGTPIITARDNTYVNAAYPVATGSLLYSKTGGTFNVGGNNASTGYLIGCEGTSTTCNINSYGGNITNSSVERFIGTSAGTPTFNIFGGGSDAYVDLADTYLGHPIGSQVSNIDASYGPLTSMQSDGTYWKPTVPPGPYSAAGTAIYSCGAHTKAQIAQVSDASSPTFLGTYSSGGAVFSNVLCNGTNWVTF